jgi:predicted ATP-binding protein involved in virulence
MKIQRIEIHNFRGFEHFTCELTDPCLIVGNNGSGKTSLMEALAIAAGSLFLGFSDIRGNQRHGIKKDDVRKISHKSGKKSKRMYPVVISCQGVVNGQEISWTRTIKKENGRTTSVDAKEIETIAQQLQQGIRKGEDIILPIVAYYSAKRWPSQKLKNLEANKPKSVILGNLNWFNPTKNHKRLWEWLKSMEFIARQKGEPWEVFLAVKEAIAHCSENIKDVVYDLGQDELILKLENQEINFCGLDKQNRNLYNLLAMVADIAYRCAVLNPQLYEQATKQTPGVVLIDDLESRLDSELEKNIMNKLRQIFPMIQFIGTTQSPLITEGIETQQIINLK